MNVSADRTRPIVVRAPTRIDLGGGWTDVPPYCDREGGFVCNIAINRYATATLYSGETYDDDGGRAPDAASDPKSADASLIAAALRRTKLDNARITLHSDFPISAGLGGSSAASAAILGAIAVAQGRAWDGAEDRAAIAEEGRRIEVEELGVAGGRQDHYAATHGGALALTFTDRVAVRRLRPSRDTITQFEQRALLIYTGESRISGTTIKGVLDAYLAGDERVCSALASMRELARAMAGSLEGSDLDCLGSLLADHWAHQRALHPAIATPRIDEIVMRAHGAGALGWKPMGASGGGCVLVLCREDGVDPVREAIAPLGSFVRFAVDRDGLARLQ